MRCVTQASSDQADLRLAKGLTDHTEQISFDQTNVICALGSQTYLVWEMELPDWFEGEATGGSLTKAFDRWSGSNNCNNFLFIREIDVLFCVTDLVQ